MASLGDRLRELGTLDRLASLDSPVHRVDPRAKVLTTLVFIILVASLGRYEVARLIPFALYPVVLGSLGGVPWGLVARRVALVMPFALVLGGLNPVLDRAPVLLGPWPIAVGWLSFASLLLRFGLCVGATVILIATTSMDGVCLALERLGLPRVFAVQIALLYRYVFVLLEEALRVTRARDLRANGHSLALAEYGSLAGGLFLRTWERARRIHIAMLARGFEGDFHTARPQAFRGRDWAFTGGGILGLALLRTVSLPGLIEHLLKGGA